jgi:glycosyltransferase involved in cell wall biosynthesis
MAAGFTDLFERRRVLFVNAIRADVPSGGATVSDRLMRSMANASALEVLTLAPSSKSRVSEAIFALVNMPAPLFVALSRKAPWVWLEFFCRLSVVALIRCFWLRWSFRPDLVVLNHHASFAYTSIFNGTPTVHVWHDVPSLKRDSNRSARRDSRCCARLERMVIRKMSHALALSDRESRFLRRFHHLSVDIISAIDPQPLSMPVSRRADRLLLVGNWSRKENREGALEFFSGILETGADGRDVSRMSFIIAGADAADFYAAIVRRWPRAAELQITTVPQYTDLSQFDACALVAPIARGAGIKIKTLEAWATGLPVIGTPQAFSGIPSPVWRIGGARLETIAALARVCTSPESVNAAISSLSASRAFGEYVCRTGEHPRQSGR